MGVFESLESETKAAHNLAITAFDVMLTAAAFYDRMKDTHPDNHFVKAWPALEALFRHDLEQYNAATIRGLKSAAGAS